MFYLGKQSILNSYNKIRYSLALKFEYVVEEVRSYFHATSVRAL